MHNSGCKYAYIVNNDYAYSRSQKSINQDSNIRYKNLSFELLVRNVQETPKTYSHSLFFCFGYFPDVGYVLIAEDAMHFKDKVQKLLS